MTTIYKDQLGRILSLKEIAETKTDSCEAYSAFDDYLNIAVFEAKGERFTQEDRVAFGAFPLIDLTFSQKKTALLASFKTLQDEFADQYPVTGSTAIISLIEKQTITTAWLGDSTSYLVIFNHEGHCEEFSLLNKNLHHPDPKTLEGKRVTEVAKENRLLPPYEDLYGIWRIGDGLAISRAIGDKNSEAFGLSHVPEFTETNYQIPLGGYGLLITACDGLTEAMTVGELFNFMVQQKSKNPEIMAKKLVARALNVSEPDPTKKSRDNVSVLVANLSIDSPNLILALFDGHNGSQISHMLSEHFLPTLLKQLQSC